MKCPFCKKVNTKVLETRVLEDGITVRRRRECPNPQCGKRFTTQETIPLNVEKNNGNIEPFDRQKVINGVSKAFGNRQIDKKQLEELARQVEEDLRSRNEPTVTSKDIGRAILAPLKDIDFIVYLRFASVYLDFTSLDDFKEAIAELEAYDARRSRH